MPKPLKRRAYLVAVHQNGEAVRVYAVLAVTADEAGKAAAPHVSREATIEIVGGLSRDLVKRLRLEPGDVRPVWPAGRSRSRGVNIAGYDVV